ncbi:hypothetical protein QZH41_002706 [Actinostola sp. cb2023]|nr:hypothetical protein QZH41_002706 [Actinostola sp. cb2023]
MDTSRKQTPPSENQIRDQIVQKCKYVELRKKLLEKGEKLQLKDVLRIATTLEAVQSQLRTMKDVSTGSEDTVNIVQARKSQAKGDHDDEMTDRSDRQVDRRDNRKVECYGCGRKGHYSRDPQCPAKGKTCNHCGKPGHFANKCREKNRDGKVNCIGSEEGEYAFSVKSRGCMEKLEVTVGGRKVQMVIDSGASANIIDKELWNSLKEKKIKCISSKSNKKLYAYGSEKSLNVLGSFTALTGIGKSETQAEFIVIDGTGEPLLGRETASELGVLKIGVNVMSVNEDVPVMDKYKEVFKGVEEERAFAELKTRLGQAETLAYFDIYAKTRVITDASPVGLGAILSQEHDGEYRVVSYASRSLTSVKKRYSQTEKEALAIVWACERFNVYLYGLEFELCTDHKPLETIYSPKSKPCARIERWVLRLQPYKFKVTYIPGKQNVADPLSRLTQMGEDRPSPEEIGAEEFVRFVATTATPQAMTTREVEEASAEDEELCELRECIKAGQWKNSQCKEYIPASGELCVIGKLILRGQSTPPSGPWQDLALDFLGPLPSGHSVLTVIDYYSRYYEIAIMKSTSTENVIESLEEIFSRHGLPLTLSSDNGPQFASELFRQYLHDHGVKYRRVTPLWPQANGEIERQNRSLLKRMKIAQAERKDWKKEVRTYLTAYRATPHTTTGVSPAELLFGRKMRTKLPDIQEAERAEEFKDRDADMKMKAKLYADERRHAEGTHLSPGDKGVQYQRNVTHVKKYLTTSDHVQGEEDKEVETEGTWNNTRDKEDLEGTSSVIQPDPPPRPVRARQMPRKFEDFVMQ